VAGPERARAQDVKAPAKADRAALAVRAPAESARPATRLPSPAVAAAILEGSERSRRAPFSPLPTRPKTAPPPLSSERSAARVQVTPPMVTLTPVVFPKPLAAPTPAPAATTPVSATPRAAAAVITLVPKRPTATPEGSATTATAATSPRPTPPTPAAAPATATAGAPVEEPPSASAPAATPGTPATTAEPNAAPAPTPESLEPAAAAVAEPEGAAKGGSKEEAKGMEAAAEPGGEAEVGAGGAAAAAAPVKLQMPEPPCAPSPATMKRVAGVKHRAGGAAAAHSALPSGKNQVGDARGAVDQPSAEAKAKAQADLIAALDEKPAPSPEIVKRCERIREVIRNKRPPDEDALMEAKPEGEALSAGNELNSTVQDETKKVQDNYGAIGTNPAGAPPAKGQDLPPQPGAAKTPGINAAAAAPDAVPPENVSLDKDVAASKQQMQDAGMETPAAQLVQSGPVAEARGAQGELEQTAKEDPAKILEGQKQALAKAEEDMAALQLQALSALTTSRATTTKGATTQQKGMVGSEESMRAQAGAEAQQIFSTTQEQVTNLLKPVASNAMAEWEAAKELLVAQFKSDLAPVQKRVDERHAGVGGFFVGLWDVVTGLPGWAEEAYARAEKNFGDGVCNRILEISVKVNTVIATCEAIIKSARERIAKIFSDLPESLGAWAAEQQKTFDGKLDALQKQAIDTRDNFNKDLLDRSAQAVDEVRAEIAELRKKAGGLIGRIANAIRKFVDDPVKFIIEGLLELLGIPPASFWAVVAKIKRVIKDIADDPMKFANNLLKGLAMGFGQFFDNILSHLLKGFLSWLTGGLGDVGVQLPKDLSLKSIVTFFLQLMGITWPRIRKVLAKHVGEKNVALLEKVYQLVSFLIEKGPEGIFEMIKEKLDPQSIVDQVIQLAVDYLISAVVKAATARILMLFNPAGAILQALEAIYRVLKWVFQNAARIFTLIETVVNGIADILAGSLGGFANAVEKALAMLIAPVISFIADYLNFGDLPDAIAKKIKSFQDWIMGLIEKALVWVIEKGKALLAAAGIGGKDKKDEKGGTPHEQAVEEVAGTLAEPPPGEPLDYDALRAAKEKEAATIVAARNQSLAAEHVKMSVTFADKSEDQKDDDLDFSVLIEPNNAKKAASVPVSKPEPIAGEHRVTRDPPIKGEVAESHHVPARALGTAISQFLYDVADRLRKGSWKGNATAARIAKAFETRAEENAAAAKSPGLKLSAILVDESAHRGEEGVHKIEGTGPVLETLAKNPAEEEIVLVKRQTATQIRGVASYVSVNPQTASWRIFLADIRRSFDEKNFVSDPKQPRKETEPVELIMATAEKKFLDAERTADEFLTDEVVDRTNQVLDRGVDHAYEAGSTTVMAAITRAKVGTPKGRQQASSDLRGVFGRTWDQFRGPIEP